MLVLASRSPQRREILTQLGIEFTVVPANVEELGEGEPGPVVVENACRKARAVGARRPGGAGHGAAVLGVDTAVVLDGTIYGKPAGEAEARASLERLSGREHAVWSGIALLGTDGGERTAAAVTTVRFRTLERAWIDWYLSTGEWRERAGGYAIQGLGSALVERVEGDFWNVVGLPVYELVRLAPELFLHAGSNRG